MTALPELLRIYAWFLKNLIFCSFWVLGIWSNQKIPKCIACMFNRCCSWI